MVIWHAGLGGSMALSLALTLPHAVDRDIHELIIAATTIIEMWTVFFQWWNDSVAIDGDQR